MDIKAIIIDDERHNIENLSILLRELFPMLTICGTATNAEYGESLIRSTRPQLVFLDIQMPGRNGFDMLSALVVHDFELIFVTAFDQFGIQAVKFQL